MVWTCEKGREGCVGLGRGVRVGGGDSRQEGIGKSGKIV